MSKMGSHYPFEFLQHKLWLTKGQESKCQFDFQPRKIKNLLELCVCRRCATYQWKSLNKGYNHVVDFISIEGLHKKLWASKMMRIPISGIMGLLTWESQEKWNLGVAPMVSHRKHYKEEGGGFLQIRAMVSLMSLCMPMVCLCTKNVPTMY